MIIKLSTMSCTSDYIFGELRVGKLIISQRSTKKSTTRTVFGYTEGG
jgi:hypothetical protein